MARQAVIPAIAVTQDSTEHSQPADSRVTAVLVRAAGLVVIRVADLAVTLGQVDFQAKPFQDSAGFQGQAQAGSAGSAVAADLAVKAVLRAKRL